MRIGVFDSGIGGLNVMKKLSEKVSGVEFYYYGDNLNAPYGNASILRLKVLSKRAIDTLLEQNVDCIVIGCNTVSCSIFNYCQDYSKVKIFGVFPPIEKGIMLGKNPLLLCTNRTKIQCKRYEKFLKIFSPNDLVEDIEKNPMDFYSGIKQSFFGLKKDYDLVILGCTHYFFRKIGIANHLKPRLTIDGADYTAEYVSKWITKQKNLKKSNENKFIFLGDFKKVNEDLFNRL